MPKLTVFDLRQHSVTDLNRLDMAIATGIIQCGDNKNLIDLKETLLAYKNIVNQAMTISQDRESEQWVDKQVKDILKLDS
jgi:hypothetical protein